MDNKDIEIKIIVFWTKNVTLTTYIFWQNKFFLVSYFKYQFNQQLFFCNIQQFSDQNIILCVYYIGLKSLLPTNTKKV